jgi:Ca2+/Na+ antiporter
MFCLLYSPKQKIVKLEKVMLSISSCTSEDMENISMCIFQYLTLYYIINTHILTLQVAMCSLDMPYCIIVIYLMSDNFTSQGESAATMVQYMIWFYQNHVSIFRNAILLLANFIIVSHRPIRHHPMLEML